MWGLVEQPVEVTMSWPPHGPHGRGLARRWPWLGDGFAKVVLAIECSSCLWPFTRPLPASASSAGRWGICCGWQLLVNRAVILGKNFPQEGSLPFSGVSIRNKKEAKHCPRLKTLDIHAHIYICRYIYTCIYTHFPSKTSILRMKWMVFMTILHLQTRQMFPQEIFNHS